MTKSDYGQLHHGASDDEAIVELYWKRDENAIKLTDQKYGKYLYTIAYRILHDGLDCEECLNDTYLATWNRIPPAKPNVFQVFISKIMRNIAVDRFRKNTAEKRSMSMLGVSLEELDECMPHSPSPEEEYALKEIIELLNGYLRGLPQRSEFIFVCRYYYADSVEDIAKMLDVGTATVYRELKATREGLKELFEKEGIYYGK